MHIYDELGLKKIINASDTYTKIGGSRMHAATLQAMAQAAEHFVELGALAQKVCAEIAVMTHNEAAFISSGCSGCMVVAGAVMMTDGNPEAARLLPDTSLCQKDEFVLFAPQTEVEALPYWQLLKLCGAKIVRAEATLQGLREAISSRCAGVWLFAGTQYETKTPDFKEAIVIAHSLGVPVLVDAAAQIPPASNLWYYTQQLGADCAVFSGGKYIKGPQSTGLLVGNHKIIDACYSISNPNMGVGRPYKVGKEEYAALYTAVKQLIACDEAAARTLQNSCLDIIERAISSCDNVQISRIEFGRLGQTAPRLILQLPQDTTPEHCMQCLREACNPGIDIGNYTQEIACKEPLVFVNAINLTEEESLYVGTCLQQYLSGQLCVR